MRIKNLLPLLALWAFAACDSGNAPAPARETAATVTDTTGGDLQWDSAAPAGMKELQIPSEGSLLQGFIYTPNGGQRHPVLLMLHGFPGNEKNLDIAQAARAHGWNVIYFDYRGSWGSQGEFSFRHCVEDVGNVVKYCKQYADSLRIDTSNIALFGHSMGGWICLKSLQLIPGLKKGFACSAWDLCSSTINARNKGPQALEKEEKERGKYFVLRQSGKGLVDAVLKDTTFHDLLHHGAVWQDKQLFMLDEHDHNRALADSIRSYNKTGYTYEVWKTDHPFTNKRQSLTKAVLAFLDK